MRRTRLVSFTLMLLLCMIAMSAVGAQVVNNRRLRIDRAIYGMSGKGSDVTNRVRSMVRNDSLDFKVNNTNLAVIRTRGRRRRSSSPIPTWGASRSERSTRATGVASPSPPVGRRTMRPRSLPRVFTFCETESR
jgi:hypothetical protein